MALCVPVELCKKASMYMFFQFLQTRREGRIILCSLTLAYFWISPNFLQLLRDFYLKNKNLRIFILPSFLKQHISVLVEFMEFLTQLSWFSRNSEIYAILIESVILGQSSAPGALHRFPDQGAEGLHRQRSRGASFLCVS